MEIFLAGIIQGSQRGTSIHDQSYRHRIRSVLEDVFPDALIYSPAEDHPNSVFYDDCKGKNVFFETMEHAATADLLIAYLPQASMGTAIEMWIASNRGRKVVVISPMKDNWCVKYLSHHVCESLEDFERFARSGELKSLLLQGAKDTRRGRHEPTET